ncbi:DUF6734 family protein [Aquimarina megaterium]|uniref:DUF6734 family protein n=1 Tax=Aquimarina megaterium TaxID=1443666 RepID=UPI000943223F|nr:DUF6734 family protein [Aquimarina megaterium]
MNQEPRIIFSLNTAPIANNRWNMGNRFIETIYMTALSILYCHLWYEDIELYVDDMAYKFLYMLPCRVTKMPFTHDKELWSASKIKAIQLQTKPFVHLDTDVFIKNKIDFNFDKVLLERKEGGYMIHYKKQIEFFNQFTDNLPFWNKDLGHSFSCGVLGFKDLSLRNRFIQAYFELEDIYIKVKHQFSPLKKKGYEPVILIEQYTLACMLDYENIKPSLLLSGRGIKEHSKQAEEIGYSHLFGVTKYKKNIIQEIEYRLFKIFPYWYDQVKTALEKQKIVQKKYPNNQVV